MKYGLAKIFTVIFVAYSHLLCEDICAAQRNTETVEEVEKGSLYKSNDYYSHSIYVEKHSLEKLLNDFSSKIIEFDHIAPEQFIFLTDVDGVLTTDPRPAKALEPVTPRDQYVDAVKQIYDLGATVVAVSANTFERTQLSLHQLGLHDIFELQDAISPTMESTFVLDEKIYHGCQAGNVISVAYDHDKLRNNPYYYAKALSLYYLRDLDPFTVVFVDDCSHNVARFINSFSVHKKSLAPNCANLTVYTVPPYEKSES